MCTVQVTVPTGRSLIIAGTIPHQQLSVFTGGIILQQARQTISSKS